MVTGTLFALSHGYIEVQVNMQVIPTRIVIISITLNTDQYSGQEINSTHSIHIYIHIYFTNVEVS